MHNETGLPIYLSISSKVKLLQILNISFAKINDNEIKKILISAIKQKKCIFPKSLESEFNIKSLQQAYFDHIEENKIKSLLEESMFSCVNDKFVEMFKNSLKNFINGENYLIEYWNSELLYFLGVELLGKQETSKYLDLYVRAQFKEGKIYWQLIKGGEKVYDRQEKTSGESITFNEKKCFYMSWNDFRAFKDSGKRSGIGRIYKEKFMTYIVENYGVNFKDHALQVYDELEKKGILDSKTHRLSHGWRALSGASVKLAALDYLNDEIKYSSGLSLKNCLKEFKEKKISITQENFVNYWQIENLIFKQYAKIIWNKLEELKFITLQGSKYVVNGEPHEQPLNAEDLKKLYDEKPQCMLNYSKTLEALYAITNSKEVLTDDIEIFRVDRDKKEWSTTVNNANGCKTDKQQYTNLWDVQIYAQLKSHRPKDEEKIFNTTIEYDHIPSKALNLEKTRVLLEKQKDTQIDLISEKLKEIKVSKESKKYNLKSLRNFLVSNKNEGNNYMVAMLDNSLSKIKTPEIAPMTLKKNIEYAKKINFSAIKESADLKKYSNEEGDNWLAIAIPEVLHDQNPTTNENTKNQLKKLAGNEVYLVMLTYINMLKEVPELFVSGTFNYLHPLGAFRYMYRLLVKEPKNVEGQSAIGKIPFTFFNENDKNKKLEKLDDLFFNTIKQYLEKKETSEYQNKI